MRLGSEEQELNKIQETNKKAWADVNSALPRDLSDHSKSPHTFQPQENKTSGEGVAWSPSEDPVLIVVKIMGNL